MSASGHRRLLLSLALNDGPCQSTGFQAAPAADSPPLGLQWRNGDRQVPGGPADGAAAE